MKFLIITVLFLFGHIISADKIFYLIPNPSRSHHMFNEPLALALAKKGHQVLMLTPFPSGKHVDNYTEVYWDGILEYIEREFKDALSFNSTTWNMLTSINKIAGMSDSMMGSKALNDIINSNSSFDLIIYDTFLFDLGLSHHFKAPVIAVTSMAATDAGSLLVGNPMPLSYVPSFLLPFPEEMTFFQRVANTLLGHIGLLATYYIFWPFNDHLIHTKFPDAPPLVDSIQNISLLFINTHYSFESPRPYMPNMIQIGGLHIVNQTLPEDLKLFLDEAKEGVILFSLGTNLKSSELSGEKIEAILTTFGKFKNKFLCKFEDDSFKVPKNVKVAKWIPQQAVLAHPNTKAFITHGGLLSVVEAIHYGVPFIGIPGFGDQIPNVARAVHKEYGLKIELTELNEKQLTHALNEVLNNPKYLNNMRKISSLLREQPLKPIDKAVYWVEHVLKHKGALHLQNFGLKLSWYQYYLLDVAAFLCAILFVILWINWYILRKTVKFIKTKISRTSKIKTN